MERAVGEDSIKSTASEWRANKGTTTEEETSQWKANRDQSRILIMMDRIRRFHQLFKAHNCTLFDTNRNHHHDKMDGNHHPYKGETAFPFEEGWGQLLTLWQSHGCGDTLLNVDERNGPDSIDVSKSKLCNL